MSPEQHVGTMKGGFLSPTSACHTFDTSADGYARSEAVSAIFVQRVSTALKKGQKIRAVIRGTAINAYVSSSILQESPLVTFTFHP